MATIKEMAIEAAKIINEDTFGSYTRGYKDGAKAALEEIEIILNANRILSHPFPTKEMRLWSIQEKIKELKGE